MSWLAIILFVMEHIPDLINIIKAIINLIHGLPHAERAQAREQARVELSAAIQSGDHDAVRSVAKSLKVRCESGMVGCPMDTVG